MNPKLARAVGEARDRLHGRLSARRAVLGAAAGAVPAAALALAAVWGAPSWLALACVGAGAAAGAAAGALARVSMSDAAVALDRATGAGDRVATAFEVDARGPKGELETRLVADGIGALRRAAFPWTFRRRDALGALAGAALGLLALAAPAGNPARAPRPRADRIVAEESERLARSAADAIQAAEKAGSPEAVEAARHAAALAGDMKDGDAAKAAAEVARAAAELRATIAALRAVDPEAALALERLADRLDAGGARLAAAAGSTDGPAHAGAGAVDALPRLPDTPPPGFQPLVPADPVALRKATWPAEYDAAVTHYFSEERR